MAEQYWVGTVTFTVYVDIFEEDGCTSEEEAVAQAKSELGVSSLNITDWVADGELEPHVDDPSDNEEWKMKGEPYE